MKQNVILAISLLSIVIKTYTSQKVYIIIHGTWARPFNWQMPGGDFYEALRISAQEYDGTTAFLNWSGKNSHDARLEGARRLVALIKTYSPQDSINIIAHSHGGNVGILASQMLKNDEYTIDTFFALGTPIHNVSYMPNMDVIKRFYNLFSFGDMIQTVGGLFDRELPAGRGIHNIQIRIDNKLINHGSLHNRMIGTWIPIEELWEGLSDQKEYLMLFQTEKHPLIVEDIERTKQREKNQKLVALYSDALRSSNTTLLEP